MMASDDNLVESIELGLNGPDASSQLLPEDLSELRDEFLRLTDKVQQIQHIYAVTGLALYGVQCLETEIQQVRLLVGKAKGEIASTQTYDSVEGTLTRHTLGKLLIEIKKSVQIDESGVKLLKDALDKRNSFVHGFFQRHELDFPTRNGQLRILDDLIESIAFFKKAERFVSVVTKLMLKHLGILQEMLDEEYSCLKTELEAKEKGC